MPLPVCPKCGSQLEVKLTFASGPKSGAPKESVDVSEVGDLLAAIDPETLSGKNLDFYLTTKAKHEKYGDTMFFSGPQMTWLKNLAAKEF